MAQNPPIDPKSSATLALHRFGLGPRPGSVAAMGSDARGALLAELDRPGAGRIDSPDLLTSGVAARTAFAFKRERRTARQAERAGREANPQSAGVGGSPQAMMTEQPATPPVAAKQGPGVPQQIYLDEARARINAALGAEIGFAERLVWFWSNH